MNNQILTVFVGPQVIPGVTSNQVITHYTVVRMICEAFHFTPFERTVGELSIAGIWKTVTSARTSSWARVKAIYR